MSTEIKRLVQKGKEFVPITLAEAVVVKTDNLPGFTAGITTLDKVLSALGITLGDFNTALQNKQDKLTEGYGISISEEGVISCTFEKPTLYKVMSPEQFNQLTPNEDLTNSIYIIPGQYTEEGNIYQEVVCIPKSFNQDGSVAEYTWEVLGTLQAELDLSLYVKNDAAYQAWKESVITAVDVTTSRGEQVIVTYDIPLDLYDSAVDTVETDYINK